MQAFKWFLYASFSLVVSMTTSGECGADEAAALRLIHELGGQVSRKDGLAEGPVVRIDLAGTAVNGTQLRELRSLKSLKVLSLRGRVKATVHGSEVVPVRVNNDDLQCLAEFLELRSLDIGYTLVDVSGLTQLVTLSQLEVLHLDGLSVRGNELEPLRGCQNLRELSLTVISELDLSVLKDLPRLETLRISVPGFGPELDPALRSRLQVLREIKCLRTLDVGVCDDVLHLLRDAQLLHKHIRASGVNGKRPAGPEEVLAFDFRCVPGSFNDEIHGQLTYVTDAGLTALRDFKSLQVLDLRDTLVTDAGILHLKVFPALCAVRLPRHTLRVPQLIERFPVFTDAALRTLAEIPGLRSLDIPSARVTDAGLQSLGVLKQLRVLNLDATAPGVTQAGVESLASLTELRYLGLAGSRKISAASLQKFTGLTQLCGLDLNSTNLTDAGLSVAKSFPELRLLNLGYTKVTGTGLESLAGLPQLESLNLQGCKFDGTALKGLRSCHHLTHLRLSQRDLTDEILATLREINRLNALDTDWNDWELTLEGERQSPGRSVALRRLDLGGSKVTDAGVADLRDLDELEVLGLRSLDLNGSGIKALAGLQRLHTVDMDLTDPIIKAVREADRIHLLSAAMGQHRQRATSAADVVTFDILATQEFVNAPLTGAGLRELRPLV